VHPNSGFLTDTLNEIRNDLRAVFKNTNLQQSIDKRHAIQTAHNPLPVGLENREALINLVQKYRDYDFGTFAVENIEPVYNDWYQREQYVKKLHIFSLDQ
jgi:hypothetical protein